MRKICYYLSMKYVFLLYAYVINPLLNLISLYWIDIFYDNMTHVGNAMHHPYYLIAWAFSTAIGLFTFSIQIWKQYHISHSLPLHFLLCSGWVLSCCIPYGSHLPGWINDAHVWIAIVCTIGFSLEWIYINTKKESFIYSEIKTLLSILQFVFLICFTTLATAGHVNALCEIIYSIGVNAVLATFVFRFIL